MSRDELGELFVVGPLAQAEQPFARSDERDGTRSWARSAAVGSPGRRIKPVDQKTGRPKPKTESRRGIPLVPEPSTKITVHIFS